MKAAVLSPTPKDTGSASAVIGGLVGVIVTLAVLNPTPKLIGSALTLIVGGGGVSSVYSALPTLPTIYNEPLCVERPVGALSLTPNAVELPTLSALPVAASSM